MVTSAEYSSLENTNPDSQNWIFICEIDDLEPTWGEAVLIKTATQTLQVAIFLLPDNCLYAVSNTDPTTQAQVMSRGIIGSKNTPNPVPTLSSPLHKETYDLTTGKCFSNPNVKLTTWKIRNNDGAVEIFLGNLSQ